MGLSQRLEMRQGQSLVMTPQLLQAIKLLQLSHLDLAAYVETELERNPLLERAEPEGPATSEAPERDGPAETQSEGPGGPDDGWSAQDDRSDDDWSAQDAGPDRSVADDLVSGRAEIESDGLDNVFPDEAGAPGTGQAGEGDVMPLLPAMGGGGLGQGSFDGEPADFEATLAAPSSLRDHLMAQLDLATKDPVQRLIGQYLIDAIDEAGYLSEPLATFAERLGTSQDAVERVLDIIHGFEPSGVGARSLSECLAIQLKERDRLDPAMQALLGRLDLVAKRDGAALKRLCGVDDEDLADMLAEIRRLDPKPGRAFGSGPVEMLVPDVFVRAAPDGTWIIDLNPETLPRVLVNQTYHARVAKVARSEADKTFLTDCLQSANWLARSLEQRAKTVLKVAAEIVRQQDGFFVHGVSHLRPLNLKTIADAIGMHESTVSRVTSNKSIGTSRGTFEMKYFFTAAIPGASGAESHSSEAVRHRIRQLVDAEAPQDVLSDDALVRKLRGEGVDIARRTIAKYRESLRIASSVERRREKAALSRPGFGR